MNPKRSRKLWLSLGITLVLLALVWVVSTAVAQEPDGSSPLSPTGGSYANTFTYQGRLLEDGQPVSGTYDFIVTIWDSSIPMANQVATCLTTTTESILIEDGIFTLYLVPDQPMNEVFSGQERWIEIEVSPAGVNTYTTLGRQPIAPTPYAWGLRSGAIISGDTSSLTGFGNAILNIDNTRPLWGGGNTASLYTRASTGSAIRAQSGGIAVYGESTWTYAIRGDAITGTAGHFTSGEGYGVYAETDGEDHWDHAGYFRANMGYGVYGVSTENYGVRGEGYFGVRGDGVGTGVSGYSTNNTGVRGNSTNGYGVHGDSTNSYGVYGTSDNGAGVYGYTGSTDGYGVVGVQTGYSTADLDFWEPGGLFGGNNGVVGISKASGGYGVVGVNKATSGSTSYGIYGRTYSSSAWAGYFYSSVGNGVYISAPAGKTGLNVAGGTKNAVVRTDEGSRLLYTEESTEVWFSDYGFGQLEDGLAAISIDPLFAQTVNLQEPYHVFVQVYGDAEVYVSNRTPTRFEVHLRDGDPSAEFSYRIVAKRLGYEEDRLERAPWADNDPNLYPEKQVILNTQQESSQPRGGPQ